MSAMLDWSFYPNFSEDEFRCNCGCGQARMDADFMASLQVLRTRCGFPFYINSGYRCEDHPAEARKVIRLTTGEHCLGKAADVRVRGSLARTILDQASARMFPRIGLKQHGEHEGRFIHLGSAKLVDGLPSPFVWTYNAD